MQLELPQNSWNIPLPVWVFLKTKIFSQVLTTPGFSANRSAHSPETRTTLRPGGRQTAGLPILLRCKMLCHFWGSYGWASVLMRMETNLPLEWNEDKTHFLEFLSKCYRILSYGLWPLPNIESFYNHYQ